MSDLTDRRGFKPARGLCAGGPMKMIAHSGKPAQSAFATLDVRSYAPQNPNSIHQACSIVAA
jgi:hypothetical protein